MGAVLSVIAISSTLLYKPLEGVKNETSLQSYEYRFKISESMSISYWTMRRLAAFSNHFADIGQWAAISPSDQDVLINNTIYPATLYNASNNILEVLGSNLLLGDDVTIASPDKYVWISESLWQHGFSGVKSVIGKQLVVNNQSYIIAGVIEDVMDVNSQQAILHQQIWFITDLVEVLSETENIGNISNEIDLLINKSTNGNATLPTREQTNQWLESYIKESAHEENLSDNRLQAMFDFVTRAKKEVIISPYRSNLLGDSEDLIIALFFAVFGLLLMATLNLLNLFIAHYQSRTKEFAIQMSLGASLFKIRLMVLLENLPSFILAATTGLLVTGWTLKSLPLITGDSLPMIDSIAINNSTIIASLLILLFLSVLFSALALVDIDKEALSNNLNSSGKGIQAQSNQWLSRLLMIFQLAIASILLTATVMIAMQSYQSVYRDLGYEIGNNYNIQLTVTDEQWLESLTEDTDNYRESEINTLLSEVKSLIENKVANSKVIITSVGPLSNSMRVSQYRSEDNDSPRIMYQNRDLSAEYFSTYKIPLLAGANLSQAQIDNDENRIVIDENMAKTLYPTLSYAQIIGKTIKLNRAAETEPMIITGIVGNTISQAGAKNPMIFPTIYSHRIDNGQLNFTVMMPEGQTISAEIIEKELKRQFPRLGNLQVRSLTEIWELQTLNERVNLWIVLSTTVLTLLLTAIGVGGLTQMTTNHRKYELAVRMATGAKQSRLVKFILKDALWMLIIGLGVGFAVSVIGYQQLQQHLDMLPVFNWLAMSALDLGLIIIVILSVLMPAWKVISSDPMKALRQE